METEQIPQKVSLKTFLSIGLVFVLCLLGIVYMFSVTSKNTHHEKAVLHVNEIVTSTSSVIQATSTDESFRVILLKKYDGPSGETKKLPISKEDEKVVVIIKEALEKEFLKRNIEQRDEEDSYDSIYKITTTSKIAFVEGCSPLGPSRGESPYFDYCVVDLSAKKILERLTSGGDSVMYQFSSTTIIFFETNRAKYYTYGATSSVEIKDSVISKASYMGTEDRAMFSEYDINIIQKTPDSITVGIFDPSDEGLTVDENNTIHYKKIGEKILMIP